MVTHVKVTTDIKGFIDRLERLGHIFLYIDGLGAIHLVPKWWTSTPSEKKFLKQHADAINTFLEEREVQA